MENLSYLAFAVAYRRVGVVLIVGDEPVFWRISTRAAESAPYAAKFTQQLIDQFSPNVVVTEQLVHAVRKGKQAKQVIATVASVAEAGPVLAIPIARVNKYKNKYAEADALIELYPIMAPLRPQVRKYFDNEPRNTVLFEALSLAESVRRGPTEQLVAAMG